MWPVNPVFPGPECHPHWHQGVCHLPYCVCMYLDIRIKTCIDSGCDKVCVCVTIIRRTEEMVYGRETLCKAVRGESDCYIVCS